MELVIRICQWNCCQSWKAVTRRCSVKKVFLKFLNSQENTCARASLLTELQTLGLKFKKFLRTPFIIGHLQWLLPNLFQKTYYSECSLWIFMPTKLSLTELDVKFALNLVLLLLNRINVYPFSHKRNKYSITHQVMWSGVSVEAGDWRFLPTIETQMTWKSPGINP